MAEPSLVKGLGISERSVAVAMITIGRYLAARDSDFVTYLAESLDHARASNLADNDLAALRLVLTAIGGA